MHACLDLLHGHARAHAQDLAANPGAGTGPRTWMQLGRDERGRLSLLRQFLRMHMSEQVRDQAAPLGVTRLEAEYKQTGTLQVPVPVRTSPQGQKERTMMYRIVWQPRACMHVRQPSAY